MKAGKGETRPRVGVGWGAWSGRQAREARERIAWGCARWHSRSDAWAVREQDPGH